MISLYEDWLWCNNNISWQFGKHKIRSQKCSFFTALSCVMIMHRIWDNYYNFLEVSHIITQRLSKKTIYYLYKTILINNIAHMSLIQLNTYPNLNKYNYLNNCIKYLQSSLDWLFYNGSSKTERWRSEEGEILWTKSCKKFKIRLLKTKFLNIEKRFHNLDSITLYYLLLFLRFAKL